MVFQESYQTDIYFRAFSSCFSFQSRIGRARRSCYYHGCQNIIWEEEYREMRVERKESITQAYIACWELLTLPSCHTVPHHIIKKYTYNIIGRLHHWVTLTILYHFQHFTVTCQNTHYNRHILLLSSFSFLSNHHMHTYHCWFGKMFKSLSFSHAISLLISSLLQALVIINNRHSQGRHHFGVTHCFQVWFQSRHSPLE